MESKYTADGQIVNTDLILYLDTITINRKGVKGAGSVSDCVQGRYVEQDQHIRGQGRWLLQDTLERSWPSSK